MEPKTQDRAAFSSLAGQVSGVGQFTGSVWDHRPDAIFSTTESVVGINELLKAQRVLLVGHSALEVNVFLERLPEAQLYVVDQSIEQLDLIRQSLCIDEQGARLHLIKADISEVSELPEGEKYDLIVLSCIDVSYSDPKGHGCKKLQKIADNLVQWLAPGGILNHYTGETQEFYGASLKDGRLSLLDSESNLKCVFRKNQPSV